jgi:alkylmercury lyase
MSGPTVLAGERKGEWVMSASDFESLKKALLAPETAFDWKLFHRLWHLLVDGARPVSLDALAQALHTSREQVQAVLERYPDAEYDQDGNLVGRGLTLRPYYPPIDLGGPCALRLVRSGYAL